MVISGLLVGCRNVAFMVSELLNEQERTGGANEPLGCIFWNMELILSIISPYNFFLSFLTSFCTVQIFFSNSAFSW